MKIRNISLAMCVGVTLCGCGGTTDNSMSKQETDENKSTEEVILEPTIPTFQTNDKFVFGNWGTPPHANTGYLEYANNPDYCNETEWKKMKDCGYNLAVPGAFASVSEIERDLEMADLVGMSVLVRDVSSGGLESLINLAGTRLYDYKETRELLLEREEAIKANIDVFAKHKSFLGINVFDEPNMDYYQPISACQDWFYKNYPNHKFYVNLLPVYATPKQLFGSRSSSGLSYTDYVASFAKDVNPYCLSYDHYPILSDYDGTPYIKEDFLYNLNEFAVQAKKAKVPAYIYIQTMGFYSNLPLSSYEEFAWQVYTSLAFGMRGILTFQYWTQLQAEYHNNVRQGIVERDGTINPIYYEVQKVFNNVKAMEDVYLSYNWDGIVTFEAGRIVNDMFSLVTGQLEKLHDVSLIKSDQDILIGQFVNPDGYAYMVTNATMPFDPVSANVSLTFDDYHYCYIVKNGTRELVKLDNHVLNLTVNSGEGTFVIPLK